jgi:hypothetical protein
VNLPLLSLLLLLAPSVPAALSAAFRLLLLPAAVCFIAKARNTGSAKPAASSAAAKRWIATLLLG